MSASTDPVMFHPVADSPVGEYAPDGSGDSLEQILASADTTAFVVVHGDDLLYEGYFNGLSRDSIQTSFSVAKSFIATLVGVAVEEGHITDLDDPVTAYVPELA
ncbi:MAG: beta-lactamase family protein, partial [Actinomycetia bacterium]|nr:beta-lactamase family protein [Actinomycetes bacterium]